MHTCVVRYIRSDPRIIYRACVPDLGWLGGRYVGIGEDDDEKNVRASTDGVGATHMSDGVGTRKLSREGRSKPR